MNSTSIALPTAALSRMSYLRKLSVGRNFYANEADRTAFFSALANLRELECLNLNWNMGIHLLGLIAVLATLPRFRRLQMARDLALVPIPACLPFEVLSLNSWNLASTDQWVYL
jgi:hypothetical protein